MPKTKLLIAHALLSSELSVGETLEIDVQNDEFIIHKKEK